MGSEVQSRAEQGLPVRAGVLQQVWGALHCIDRPPPPVLHLVHVAKASAGHSDPVILEILLAEHGQAAQLPAPLRTHGTAGAARLLLLPGCWQEAQRSSCCPALPCPARGGGDSPEGSPVSCCQEVDPQCRRVQLTQELHGLIPAWECGSALSSPALGGQILKELQVENGANNNPLVIALR